MDYDARYLEAIPDEFIEHGDRSELLADLGLDANGLVNTAQQLAKSAAVNESAGAV